MWPPYILGTMCGGIGPSGDAFTYLFGVHFGFIFIWRPLVRHVVPTLALAVIRFVFCLLCLSCLGNCVWVWCGEIGPFLWAPRLLQPHMS